MSANRMERAFRIVNILDANGHLNEVQLHYDPSRCKADWDLLHSLAEQVWVDSRRQIRVAVDDAEFGIISFRRNTAVNARYDAHRAVRMFRDCIQAK